MAFVNGKTETELKVKELALQGMGARKIAKELNIGKTTASNYLRKLGMTDNTYSNEKLTDEEITKIIETKCSKYEYIGGYTNSNGFIYLMCKGCGHIFKQTAQIVRPSRIPNIQCTECNKKISEQNKIEKKLLKEIVKQKKKEEKQIAILKEQKEKEINKTCIECGEKFVTTRKNAVCCSPECTKKRANNHKDRRLKKCDIVDNGITLSKLVKRDKGICYICGKKVNMKADSNSDWYGSIDHVKAIANGGNHTWDNVKLAHRYCNTIKSDDELFINEEGQLTMAI